MEAGLAWTIVGSVAGVAAVVSGGIFGVLQLREDRGALGSRDGRAGEPASASDGKAAGEEPDRSPQVIVPALVRGRGVLGQPPRLPLHLVNRADLLDALVDDLLSGDRAISVVGMGGAGKSVLAAAAFRDPRVAGRFPGGLTWLDAGPDSDPLALLALMAGRFGLDHARHGGRQRLADVLSAHLADRELLIVADNVWSQDPLDALIGLGPNCTVLFTTRRVDLANTYDARRVEVGDLSPEQAAELLARWAGVPVTELPPEARAVCIKAGGLALGVAVAGAMVRNGREFSDVLELFGTDFDSLRADLNPAYKYQTLYVAINVGIGELPSADQQLYLDLACTGHAPFPRRAAEALWSPQLSAAQAGNLLAELTNRSLLTDLSAHKYLLHDVVYEVLAHRLGAAGLASAHGKLLDGYAGEHCGSWAWAAADPYLASTLCWHLDAAGRHVELRAVLSDLAWITGRLAHSSLSDLVLDYQFAADDLTRHIRRALLQSARAVATDPGLIRGQLASRLSGQTDAKIASWADELSRHQDGRPALLAVTAALTPATSPAEQVLDHPADVTAVAINSDGYSAFSGCRDGSVFAWNLATGRRKDLTGTGREIKSIAVSADGSMAVARTGGEVWLWDVTSGEGSVLASSAFFSDSIALAADGSRAIAGDWHGNLWLWDVPSGREAQFSSRTDGRGFYIGNHNSEFPDQSACLGSVAISADGSVAATGTYYGAVLLWDLATGVHTDPVRHGHSVEAVAMTPDGQRIVFTTYERVLHVWDPSSDRHVEFPDNWRIGRGATVTADGTMAFVGGMMWNLATGEREVISRHPIGATAVSADGSRAVTSQDRAIRVWDLTRSAPAQPRPAVTAVAFASDGHLALSGSDEGTGTWELPSGRYTPLPDPADRRGSVEAVAITPDGTRALSVHGRYPSRILLWDVGSGDATELAALKTPPRAVAISADGTTGVVAGWAEAWTYDLETGQQQPLLQGLFSSNGDTVTLTPDAKWAVARRMYQQPALSLLNVATMTEAVLAGWEPEFTHRPRSVAVSDSGHRVLVGDAMGVIHLWIRADGAPAELTGHEASVSSIAITADGGYAVSGDSAGVVIVWDLASAVSLARWIGDYPISTVTWLKGRNSQIGIGQHGDQPYIVELRPA